MTIKLKLRATSEDFDEKCVGCCCRINRDESPVFAATMEEDEEAYICAHCIDVGGFGFDEETKDEKTRVEVVVGDEDTRMLVYALPRLIHPYPRLISLIGRLLKAPPGNEKKTKVEQ